LNISEPGKYIVKNFQSAQEIDGAADDFDFDEMDDADMGDMDDEEDFDFDEMGDDDMDMDMDVDGEDMESEDDLVDIEDEDDFEEDEDMEEEEEEEELDEEVVYEIEMDESDDMEEGWMKEGSEMMDEGYAMSLEKAKAEAKRISDEEGGVAQHVNEVGNGKYVVSDFYDADKTVASFGVGIDEIISQNIAMSRRAPGRANNGAPKGPGARQTESVNKYKAIITESEKKYKTLLTETEKLKSENEEFRKALKEFRTKLVETVVFNSNLTYVTKLFMEHSTTKAEKENIMKRFDNEATTIKESKKLYKTIANELTTRKPINESVENKFSNKINTSGAKQLNERTAYVDPSTKRIIDLINRVENK